MAERPKFDPLFEAILVALLVFATGLALTNDAVRAVVLHPFS